AAEARRVASLWVSDHVIFPRHEAPGYPGGRFPPPPHRAPPPPRGPPPPPHGAPAYPGGRFPHPPDRAYLEPVVVLAAAAVCTRIARLGASVFILGHRHPVVMAKM